MYLVSVTSAAITKNTVGVNPNNIRNEVQGAMGPSFCLLWRALGGSLGMAPTPHISKIVLKTFLSKQMAEKIV